MDLKLKQLQEAIDAEFQKAEKGYNNAKKSAQEIARSAALSPSQAGDRYHSQGAADLARERYESILDLKNEVEEKGETVCVRYNDQEIFLVDNPVLISGFTIVSTKSPLGIKLLNEKKK